MVTKKELLEENEELRGELEAIRDRIDDLLPYEDDEDEGDGEEGE
jgi:regulator of replication initiation timing